MKRKPNRSVDEIRNLLEGPVNSIPTSFTEDGEIDFDGVRNVVEAGIAGGSNVTLLTYGDSHFEVLTDDEIAELTQVVIDQCAGRALTVAATGLWSTRKAVEFGRFCRDQGADLLMLTVGFFFDAYGPPDLETYHRAVAREIPVMLFKQPSLQLLEALQDEPRVCSFKEDSTEAYAGTVLRRFGNRYKMMGGGLQWRHFTIWPFGCRSYMTWWCHLKPEVCQRYWRALLSGDLPAAAETLSRFDMPFLDLGERYTGGYAAMWRGALKVLGLAKHYRRPPLTHLSEAELERLKGDLERMGVSP